MTHSAPDGQRYRTRDGWTDRQKQVLDLLARSRTNRQIAEDLGITLDGAKWHVSEILGELGLDTREEAAEWWRQQNGLRARMRILTRAFSAPGMFRWLGLGGAGAAGLAAVTIAAVVIMGTGQGGARPAEEPTAPAPAPTSPAATPASVPTLTAAGQQDGTQVTLVAATAAGGPCPVDDDICDLAVEILPSLRDGDVDALMSIAEPAPVICPGGFFSGPAPACDGIPDGQTAHTFSYTEASHGIATGEQGFREALTLTLTSVALADASEQDNYGDGRFQVASVGCFRQDQAATGGCDDEMIDLVYTHIDPEWPAEAAQRVVTCVGVWRTDAGELRVTRVGCGVPPTAKLYELDLAASHHGTEGIMQWYPWRVE